MSDARHEARQRRYAKGISAKATVGESQELAHRASVPAFIAARFAMFLSIIACLASAMAIAIAVAR